MPSPVASGALSVANALANPEQDAIRGRTVAAFRERHPQVRVEEVSAPIREYNQKLLAMLADGTLPDVLHLYFGQAIGGPADLAARGALLPLGGYVARDAGPAAPSAGRTCGRPRGGRGRSRGRSCACPTAGSTPCWSSSTAICCGLPGGRRRTSWPAGAAGPGTRWWRSPPG